MEPVLFLRHSVGEEDEIFVPPYLLPWQCYPVVTSRNSLADKSGNSHHQNQFFLMPTVTL